MSKCLRCGAGPEWLVKHETKVREPLVDTLEQLRCYSDVTGNMLIDSALAKVKEGEMSKCLRCGAGSEWLQGKHETEVREPLVDLARHAVEAENDSDSNSN